MTHGAPDWLRSPPMSSPWADTGPHPSVRVQAGDITPGAAQGLFFRDTRFVSLLGLRVNGARPEPLAAEGTNPFSATFVLRAAPLGGAADSTLLVFRHRYVGRGMREDIVVFNHGEESTYLVLGLL